MKLVQDPGHPALLYLQYGDGPGSPDELAAMACDPAVARMIARAANGERPLQHAPAGASPGARVLDLPLRPETAAGTGCRTIREYLVRLLLEFFTGEADQEYGMTGESDWDFDLYIPMIGAGLSPARTEYENDGTGLREAEVPLFRNLLAQAIGELR
jgi:hypothetical protein